MNKPAIGDLRQLSPVIKEDDREILREFYDSMYFFGCRALSLSDLVVIELKHIYRQSDIRFTDLLNRVRDNQIDRASLQELNSRYRKDFRPDDHAGYITLNTHNRNADATTKSSSRVCRTNCIPFMRKSRGIFRNTRIRPRLHSL